MERTAKYNDTVMDHYRNPRNVGEISGTPAVAQVGDPASGDVLRISLLIEGDTVVDARFKSFGCTVAIAAGSMATTLVKGRPVAAAEQLTNQDVSDALGGIPEAKRVCSVLAEQAVREAVRRFRDAAGPGEARPACR